MIRVGQTLGPVRAVERGKEEDICGWNGDSQFMFCVSRLFTPADEESSFGPPWFGCGYRYTRRQIADAEAELVLLREAYGLLLCRDGTRAYVKRRPEGWMYEIGQYLWDRDLFFGSVASYEMYRWNAHQELEEKKLRNNLGPPRQVRLQLSRWKEAQDCFYAWTRRAYENAGGNEGAISAIIRAGASERLKEAMARVSARFTESMQVQWGTFRPMKRAGGYRLGTISDHAFGCAVDILPATNPQLSSAEWKHLLGYTGLSLDVATRKRQWEKTPQELYASIRNVSQRFVDKLREASRAERATGLSPAQGASGQGVTGLSQAQGASGQGQAQGATGLSQEQALTLVQSDPHLKALGAAFVRKWVGGFFNLPWDLVKLMHEEGFRWGAVFSSPDLHHFEIACAQKER